MVRRVFFGFAFLLITLIIFTHWFLPDLIEPTLNKTEPHEAFVISAQAKKLHESLFIVDLHTDSLLWKRDLAVRSTRGHVDLPRLRAGNVGLQVFSATTKSPRGQNYVKNSADSDQITLLAVAQLWPISTWTSIYQRAVYQLDKLVTLTNEHPSELKLIRTQTDLKQLLNRRLDGDKLIGAAFLIEGAHPLEGDLENLARLKHQGMIFVGMTHFFDNRTGGSLHGISQQGLTAFGKEVVTEVNRLELIIDIAHASPQMVEDILALSERPVILSHGGFKGICDTPRNLNDTLMQQVARQGGIIGVGYWEGAICDNTPLGVVRALRYGIDLMGLEHIALGSDYDGTILAGFDTSELAVLTQTMLDEGFSEPEIRAVMGDNMKNFLMAQLPTEP